MSERMHEDRAGSADLAPHRGTPSAASLIWVALGLAGAGAAANGLGRFAYALLLPTMQHSLAWSFSTAGSLSTANAVGYLAGSAVAGWVVRRVGAARTTAIGTVVVAVSLAASALSADVVVLTVLRVIAGVAGAAAFVAGAVIANRLSIAAGPRRAAVVLGLYFSGPGIGITLSAITVPATAADGNWRLSWVLLGVLGVLCLGAILLALRAVRAHDGGSSGEPESRGPESRERWPVRPLTALLAGYVLFGVGYIAYITFIVAYLGAKGVQPVLLGVFWVVLGLAALGGGFAWAPLLARTRGGRGPAVLLLATAVGAVLPVLDPGPVVAIVSAVVFGGSFLAVITAVTGCARELLPQRHHTGAIAGLTTAFALGQAVGPVLAGVVSDRSHDLGAGLVVGAIILGVAALVALVQSGQRTAA